ncbi:MAG: DUF11 domain-containing protein, partial [Chloroflexi bacterium]|nr:DUF11 domain-containing protein [Chloroflexota bacterium]
GIANPGDVIVYSFTVTNTGNVTLTNVTVSDPLVTVVGGPLASLAVGATDSTTFAGTYSLTQADIDAGKVDNIATTSGTAPDGTGVSDDDTHTEPVPASPAIQLVKSGSLDLGVDGIADPGDLITYSFTVTNTGNVTLIGVTVSDPLVTVIGGPLASLAVGASDGGTFSGSYALTQADIDAGKVDNIATTSGTAPDGTGVSDDDTHTEPVPANPAIELLKSGSLDLGVDGIANPGDVITYSFTVTNTGNVTLTGVTVSDPLVTVVGGPLASLAVGATDSTTFSGSYAITQADVDAGGVDNIAIASGEAPGGDVTDPTDDITDDDTHTEPVPQISSIDLVKLADRESAFEGDVITYSFTVTNTGNTTLTNVTVSDPLVTVSGGPLASLAPGTSDSTTFSATYVVTAADVAAGSFKNVATVSGEAPGGDPTDPTDDVTDEGDDTVTFANLSIVKGSSESTVNVSLNNTAEADFTNAEGSLIVSDSDLLTIGVPTVTYTITVTNSGDADATGVVLGDTLPVVSGADVVILDDGLGTYNEPLNLLTWVVDVNAGTTVSVSFTVTVHLN